MLEQSQYNEWVRSDWSGLYQYMVQQNTPNAAQLLWDIWNVEQNPNREHFKSIEALVFNLVHYRAAQVAIGAFSITADSIPIYNTWSNQWNGLEDIWECEQWVEWYEKNANKYGSNSTKYKFINAWNHHDNFSMGFSWDGAGYHCGKDCDFINFFRLKGIDVAQFGATTACNLVAIPTNLIDATASLSNTIKKTATITETLLPIGLAALFISFIYKRTKE